MLQHWTDTIILCANPDKTKVKQNKPPVLTLCHILLINRFSEIKLTHPLTCTCILNYV